MVIPELLEDFDPIPGTELLEDFDPIPGTTILMLLPWLPTEEITWCNMVQVLCYAAICRIHMYTYTYIYVYIYMYIYVYIYTYNT